MKRAVTVEHRPSLAENHSEMAMPDSDPVEDSVAMA